jgi:MFS family permease
MNTFRARIPKNVFIISFVSLASGFGQDIITPVLPVFLAAIGVSYAHIGAIDGLLQGTMSVFRFISGVLSDHFRNRKFFIFLGYSLSSVARPLLALTSSFIPVVFLRILDGAGKGMKDAPRDSLIADSSHRFAIGRAFGFQRLVDTAGSVFGPIAAAAILFAFMPSLASYRLIFAISTIPGVIALALIFFGVKEPARHVVRGAYHKKQKKLSLVFWIFTFATSLAMLTKINDSLFLVRAHDVGIPQEWIPVLFAGFTLVYAVCAYPIGIWSDKIGRLPMIALGWLILSGVEFGFSFAQPLYGALALFVLYGLFYAFTEGSARACIARFVPQELRGNAYGIFYTLTGISVIIGGYGLGYLWDAYSSGLAFFISACGSFAACIVFVFLFKISQKNMI